MPKVSPVGVIFLFATVVGCMVGTMFYLFWPVLLVTIIIAIRKGPAVLLDSGKDPVASNDTTKPIAYTNLYYYTTIPRWAVITYNTISNFILLTWLQLIAVMIEVLMKTRIRYSLVSSQEGLPATHRNSPITDNQSCQAMLDSFMRCDATSNAQRSAHYANIQRDHETRKTAKSLGVKPVPKQFTILVMSHRTTLDWMFAWCFLARTKALLGTIRFVLKSSLAKIPWVGWCCQMLRFMFLTRKWETDEAQMKRVIEGLKYAPGDDRVTLLIFPEGTDSSPIHVEQSRAFAAKNGLPQYMYVLNPRTTGLVGIKNMIGAENIELIVDITAGYRDFTPGKTTAPSDTLSNTMPKEVHFMCERFVFAENKMIEGAYSGTASSSQPLVPHPTVIPSNDEGFKSWINSRFELKERDFATYFAEAPVDFVPSQIERVTYQEVRGPSGKLVDCSRRVLCATDPLVESYRSSIGTRIRSAIVTEVGIIHYAILPVVMYLIPGFYLLVWEMFINGLIFGVFKGLLWGYLVAPLLTTPIPIDSASSSSSSEYNTVLIVVLWLWAISISVFFMKVLGSNKRFVPDHRTFDNVCLYGPHGLPQPPPRGAVPPQ